MSALAARGTTNAEAKPTAPDDNACRREMLVGWMASADVVLHSSADKAAMERIVVDFMLGGCSVVTISMTSAGKQNTEAYDVMVNDQT